MTVSLTRKIKTLSELAHIVAQQKRRGKVVVHCHGVFDLVHPGHIKHFHSARKEGDFLVVTVTADKYVKRGPGRPIFNEQLRAESLAALADVDYVAIIHAPTAIEAIKTLKPNVYAKGPDYKQPDKDITGWVTAEEKAVKSVRGRLFITDDITFSTSTLLNNHLSDYPLPTRQYLRSLSRRYTIDDIIGFFEKIRTLKILVIGDTIIDEYHYCSPLGRSSKDPLVTNQYLSAETFAGGTLATANHVAALAARLELVSLTGQEKPTQNFIAKHLQSTVRPKIFIRPNSATTTKRRYVSHAYNRKIFEICFMEDTPISGTLEHRINLYLKQNLPRYDLVVVNDFGHGLLTPTLIKTITSRARLLALNVQTNSANIGFNVVTKYPRADFVCIDELELRYATHDRFSHVRKSMRQIHRAMKAKFLITTRGSEGALAYDATHGFISSAALAHKVIDPVGAGDAFFAFTAPCFAVGMPPQLISFVGNAVGAMAVQIVGNRESVQKIDLIKFMTRLLK